MREAIRKWRAGPRMRVPADSGNVEAMTVRYLMYVLLPAWFVPGAADWLLHRRTRIEDTTGLRESLIHALMMGEISVPVTLVLLCEVNAPLLALCVAASGAHEATAIWDVRTAVYGGREVSPAEQHVHSFLESLPFMATSALLCLHWDQVAGRSGDFWKRPLRLRPRRLPGRYLVGVAGAVGAFVVAPYGEELLRCLRARRDARAERTAASAPGGSS